MIRALIAAVGIGGVIVAPVWVPLIAVFALAMRWRSWETLVIGMMADILWLPFMHFWGMPIATLFAIVLVWILEPIRKELLLGRA